MSVEVEYVDLGETGAEYDPVMLLEFFHGLEKEKAEWLINGSPAELPLRQKSLFTIVAELTKEIEMMLADNAAKAGQWDETYIMARVGDLSWLLSLFEDLE